MTYNFRAGVCRLMAEWYNTKSNVKLGGFQSKLEASYVASHTEELRYNERVCQWMTIYTLPTGAEHFGEGINGCHSRNAKLLI